MKKFFSLIAAVLFAGSMMAQVTILPTDFTATTEADYSVTKDGVTVAVVASTVTNDQMRIFKGKTITISAESNISSIEFTCTANGTAKYGPGCFNAQDGYTFEAAGKKGTWVGSATSVTFTAESNQVRATQIVVTLGGEVPPIEPTMDYYVVGSMTSWKADAAYKLAANPAVEGEYIAEFAFAANAEFKVAYSDGSTIEDANWFPQGTDNNYKITEAGDYKITFNPAGNVEGWYEGFFNVVKKEAPVAISCLEVYQLAKDDVVGLLNPVTVTYSNGANVWVMDGSASMLIYLPSGFTNNFQAGDVLSGIAGVVDIYQNVVYEVKPSADQAAAIVATPGEAPAPSQHAVIEASDVNQYVILPGFSIEGAFTADAKTSLPAVLGENTVTIYNNFKFAYTFEAGKTYNITGVVSAYKGDPQVYFISAEEAGGEVPPTPSINYYVIGSMTEWNVDANYKLVANPAVEGEYMGEFTFANNDEFKIAGDDGSQLIWYPGGTDNNYKITEAGDYKITFNPAGNVEGWYAGYYNVVKKEEPVIPQYEVAEAIAAGLAEDTEILVRGVISKMQIKGKNFARYGSVNIYVTDATGAEGELEFFNCFSFNADTFRTTTPAYDAEGTTWDDLKKVADENGNEIRVGDTIIAQGKYQFFNNKTHQLKQGCYIVDLKPAPVAPAQDINVNMSDGLRYDDYVASDGWWQIYGSDEQYSVSISNVATTQAEGTYTIADLDADYTYITAINSTDTTHFVDGSVILSIDAQTGNVTVAGTLVGDDGNNYIFNLQYIVPTAKEEVSVIITDGELYDEYAEDGLYVVYGEDANEVYVQLAIWAENGFEGNFTEEDLDGQYVGSFLYEGEEYVEIYSATITVTPGNGGDYNVTATILGYNNKQYNVTMYVPGGEGIEETLAAGKAAKVLRDGQVLILKGDKTFNVMGARIR